MQPHIVYVNALNVSMLIDKLFKTISLIICFYISTIGLNTWKVVVHEDFITIWPDLANQKRIVVSAVPVSS